MWTNENRAQYDRSHLRYPSDLTDDEWTMVEPLIPPGKRGGDKRTVIMREVVNGLMYILSTGCQWRAIPKDLPPRCWRARAAAPGPVGPCRSPAVSGKTRCRMHGCALGSGAPTNNRNALSTAYLRDKLLQSGSSSRRAAITEAAARHRVMR